MGKKKKEEFGGASDFKVKQMLGGGPVERAIKADLISLRKLFYQRLHAQRDGRASGVYSVDKGRSGKLSITHRPRGYSFRVFKEVFKESKFGIIFTRAAPPISRIDKEAFVQLIYSAAFSLLKDALKREVEEHKELEQNDPLFFDAVFAIYGLYTTYNTNPAPRMPQQKADEERYKLSSSVHVPASSLSPTSNELELLSTLPLDLSNVVTEAETKYYRRSYHSPIRISYESMQRLIRLRSKSFLIVDQCHQKSYEDFHHKRVPKDDLLDDSDSNSKNSANDKDGPVVHFTCRCSLANDCITLIDRLISNQCFQFCEYDGPVSVESLGGSDDYVRLMILNEQHQAEKNDSEIYVINDHVNGRNNKSDSDGPTDQEKLPSKSENYSVELQLEKLQKSFWQYQDTIGKLSMSLRKKNIESTDSSLGRRKNMNNKKNQLSLIQESIEPIMEERQRRRAFDLRQKIQNIFSTNIINGSTDIGTTNEDPQQREEKNSQLAADISNGTRRMKLSPPQPAETSKPSIRFIYPETFSKSLKEGLGNALKEITLEDEEKKHKRNKRCTPRSVPLESSDDFFLLNNDSDAFCDIFENDSNNLHDSEDANSIDESIGGANILGSGKAALQLLLRKGIHVTLDVDPLQNDGKHHQSKFAKSRSNQRSPCEKDNKKRKKRQTTTSRTRRRLSYHSDDISLQSKISNATSMSANISGSGNAELQKLLNTARSSHQIRSRNKDRHSKSTNESRRIEQIQILDDSYGEDYHSLADNQNSEIHVSDENFSLSSKTSTTATEVMEKSGREALQQLLHRAAKPRNTVKRAPAQGNKKSAQNKSNTPRERITHTNSLSDENASLHSFDSTSSYPSGSKTGGGKTALQILLEASKI